MADPITTSTSDSLQSSLWCVEKSTGKKAKFYQNSLYTDVVLFFFSFFLKTSAISGEEKKKIFFPYHYPFALAVNKLSPVVYILSTALDVFWRGNRGSVNRLYQEKERKERKKVIMFLILPDSTVTVIEVDHNYSHSHFTLQNKIDFL